MTRKIEAIVAAGMIAVGSAGFLFSNNMEDMARKQPQAQEYFQLISQRSKVNSEINGIRRMKYDTNEAILAKYADVNLMDSNLGKYQFLSKIATNQINEIESKSKVDEYRKYCFFTGLASMGLMVLGCSGLANCIEKD